MENEIDAFAVANEAIMLRTAVDKTIMLIEGSKDYKVFSHFIDHEECELVISHGQANAVGALHLLRTRKMNGVICVIDSDFSFFVPLIEDPDIVRTDLHDLETMIFNSPAFDKVLAEFGSKAKVENFVASGKNPRVCIRDAAHYLGLVRLYSSFNRFGIDFEGFGLSHVDRRSLEVDIDKMVQHAVRRSRKSPDYHGPIRAHVVAWLERTHDRWHVCCGHDLAEVFGLALSSLLGTQNATMVKGEQIERALRLAYEWRDFVRTRLYKAIRFWEARNSPYLCLIAEAASL
jgi:hypothetical protein